MRIFKNLLLCLSLLVTVPFAAAQDNGIVAKPAPDAQAGKKYWLKVTLPDGTVAKIRTREGEMASVVLSADGRGIGITPVPGAGKSDTISLKISNIATGADKQEIVADSAVVRVDSAGEAFYSHDGLAFKIELMAGHSIAAKNEALCNHTDASTNTVINVGRCCVTCGATTACGIAVDLGCGSCCSDC